MKQSALYKCFSKTFSELVPGASYLFDGFHRDLLQPFVRSMSLPVVCVVPDDQISSLYNYFPSMEDDMVFVPPKGSGGGAPAGFRSEGTQHLLRSSGILAGGAGAVAVIISSETGMFLPIVGGGESDCLVLEAGVEFNDCINFFDKNGYSVSSVVSVPGDYCMRGGIVDIYPFSSKRPIRINFLSGEVSLHFFDVETQLTADLVDSFTIFSLSSHDMLTIRDASSSDFVTIYININGCFDSLPYKNIGFLHSFGLVDVKMFEQYYNNDKINIYEDDLLSSTGVFHLGSDLYIPAWFLNKRPVMPFPAQPVASVILNAEDVGRGDFLVHRDHGVGVCLGLALSNNGSQEFLSIRYGDGGVVRIDVARLGLVSFFAPKGAGGVVLDLLGAKGSWTKKRSAALRQAEETIDHLIDLYVRRKNIIRRPFVCDDDVERSFIDNFPFTDTEDQIEAWKHISEDLTSSSPMDRLLCGDVGFGKTELAMRAAFRVVFGGLRVVVLVPTTLLAGQLLASFKSRLDPYAIMVDVVSRFRTSRQISKTKSCILAGKNDVLIGTHSVLNDDIYLNNIGLLIIDEEHRFGVAQKERIRLVKKNVDVLSMSATPIPRSINMALSGIYSISLLQTPPIMRQPITTRVAFYSDHIIYNAISFEVSRGGQIYFVHNDLQSIASVTLSLQNMFPALNIVYLHGKEPSKRIESNMLSFVEGTIHVLVCSSIIEAGIDVSNANCIIINNVHLFGLSQLYQMRGRVGRGHRAAYAYLLVPRGLDLSAGSFSRIKAIESHTRLGSGYNISRTDMEIRGSGSLFGYKQSGGATSVGYEMYLKLIQQSLHVSGRLATKFKVFPDDVFVEIYNDRGMPDTYVADERLRISFYKDLVSSSSVDIINKLECVLENRFGPLPSVLNCFINECRLKIVAAECGVRSIKNKGCGLLLQVSINAMGGSGDAIINYIHNYFSSIRVAFHFLPEDSGDVFVCLHLRGGLDNYIILFNCLNKFRI